MLELNIAQQVLAEALTTGGDFSEIFWEDTLRCGLSYLGGSMEQAISGRDHGAGIRVLKGTHAVYVYTNDTSLAGLMDAARKAAAAIGSERLPSEEIVLSATPMGRLNPIAIAPNAVSARKKAAWMREAYQAAKAYSQEISQVSVGLNDSCRRIVIANSEGLYVPKEHTHVRIRVGAVAEKDGETQTGMNAPGWQRGYEALEELDIAAMAQVAAKQAVTMLHADLCPAGRMPVAIENGFGGVLFHEACGHSLEATGVSKGHSEFCGKLGQQIASPIVTAIDDGTIPNGWGSGDVDDEGAPTRRNVLIKKGILKQYLVDKLGGRRMGMEPNGCGRRQNYTFAPTSRMSNTFIAPGTDDNGEIIASMGDGLYCASMGGGSVNPMTGDFNFAVSEGYLVRNGKIDKPVRGATLIGRGSQILMAIDRVGTDMKTGQGMCGSLSGSIPADVGQPLIRIREITVGGR